MLNRGPHSWASAGVLPRRRPDVLDPRVERQQRRPRHAVLQPGPRGAPQRVRARRRPLLEPADPSPEGQDLFSGELEGRWHRTGAPRYPTAPEVRTPTHRRACPANRVRSVPVSERRLPPLLRQWRDPLGLGRAAQSRRSADLEPRTKTADRVVQSICPYCAVGCGQKVYVKDEKVVQIEGDPDSPISPRPAVPEGRGVRAATSTARCARRASSTAGPHGTEWEDLDLDTAMDMIADRVVATRDETWEDARRRRQAAEPHARASALLGGATLDTEENYLHQEVLHRAGRDVDREPGPHMTLARRSPVWGPRSGAAAPPRSSRTCRTPTAS